ncbi:MAG: hypothetical protein GY913_04215 [Proteobacteria bacterium]|nr:hypothetical protein [Pseudomonadota bacterium]MCP4916108.1 hypothetical protein [Pseudomonadota bacterium]
MQERLRSPSLALELLLAGRGGRLDDLASVVQHVAAETGATTVVAHGTAVPVALRLRGLSLVILNGPTERIDTVTATLGRLGPSLLERLVLRRSLLDRWLASSAGLRRLVANPYAMDRDIVVALSRPMTSSSTARRAAAEWICDVAGSGAVAAPESPDISGIWGDHDPLYPVSEALRVVPRERLSIVPGGRHLFPEERPWELADRLQGLLDG